METDLQQRLLGAIVLVMIAVIFIPLILSDRPVMESTEQPSMVEPGQDDESFNSSVIPVTPEDELTVTVPENTPAADNDTLSVQAEEIPSVIEPTTTAPMTVEQADEPETEQPAVQAAEKVEESVQTSNPASTLSSTRAEDKTKTGTVGWVVQLASFSSEENAKKLNQRLLEKNYQSFIEPLQNSEKNTVIYRVRVGPAQQDKAKVEAIRQRLKQSEELEGIVIEYP